MCTSMFFLYIQISPIPPVTRRQPPLLTDVLTLWKTKTVAVLRTIERQRFAVKTQQVFNLTKKETLRRTELKPLCAASTIFEPDLTQTWRPCLPFTRHLLLPFSHHHHKHTLIIVLNYVFRKRDNYPISVTSYSIIIERKKNQISPSFDGVLRFEN